MVELHPLFPRAFGFAEKPELVTEELVYAAKSVPRKPNTNNDVSAPNRLLSDSKSFLSTSEAGLNSFIMENLIDFYRNGLGTTDEVQPVITQSWLTYTKRGEKMHGHAHPNSVASGVFYINAVQGLDQLIFEKEVPYQHIKYDYVERNEYTGKQYIIPVKTGDLILFRSDQWHYFNEVEHDEERISLAFNSFPIGQFGEEDLLTHLVIDSCT